MRLSRSWFVSCLSIGLLVVALSLVNGCRSTANTSLRTPTSDSRNALPSGRHAQLAAAIAGSDRIVVSGLEAGNAEAWLDTRGANLAAEFLANVQIDDLAGDFHCDCGPAYIVRFFRGVEPLAELTFRHNNRWVRWKNGLWTGDALVRGEFASQGFTDWFTGRGGDRGRFYPGQASGLIARQEEEDRKFTECFPAAAQPIARSVGAVTKEGFEPWKETSDLPKLIPDGLTLATATFRGLGMVRQPWHVDDYRIAATQTATADLSPENFVRALRANATDDQAMRGAARVYFRMSMHRRLTPAANAEWLPRLADAMLRTGPRFNLGEVLVYVAATHEPAAREFLREVATGARTYPWPTDCQPHMEAPHEPSLRAAAAVLLALYGDRQAPRLAAATPNPVPGLDAAAIEIAKSLLDPVQPLRAAHFRYESRILTYAATEAALRLPVEKLPASVLGAALLDNDHSFNRQIVGRLFPIARELGVQIYREPTEVVLSDAPVESNLALSDPKRAIEECTKHLPSARGVVHTALLLIRALAYETEGNGAAAITDYGAALKAGRYSTEIIEAKLAWLSWGENRIEDAARHAEGAIQAKPSADMLFLRGLSRYAMDDFSESTAIDFTAALALQPNHGYAQIFQHLTACLGWRPQSSQIASEPRYLSPAKTVINIQPSTGSIFFGQTNGAIEPWPAALIDFLKGKLTEQALTVRATASTSANLCEANFYISQQARIAGDRDAEVVALRRCAAIEQPELIERRLAILRLKQLQ